MISAASIVVLSLVSVSLGIPHVITPKLTVVSGTPKFQSLRGVPHITPKQYKCGTYSFPSAGTSANFTSPGYYGNYPAGTQCNYDITSPTGTTMQITCQDFNVPCSTDGFYVSLSGDSTLQSNSQGYCGAGLLASTTTVANRLYFSIRSGSTSTGTRRVQCTVTVSSAPTAATTTTTTTTPAPTVIIPSPTSSSTCQCGLKYPQTRIVGGTAAAAGEFPWRVMLFVIDPATNSGGICGGTIISKNWVLTAAHCTMDMKSTHKIQVYYNTTVNAVTTGANAKMIVADRYIQHPSFSGTTLDSDLTLVHLPTPLPFGKNLNAACLPYAITEANLQGQTVQASGFGTTQAVKPDADNTSPPSNTLQRVDLPVLTTTECKTYLGSSVTNNMFCTYLPGKDTCQGDSGGGIDLNFNSRNYVVGVTSFGIGCAQTGYPGVYAKVSNFLPWIEQNTGESFCKP